MVEYKLPKLGVAGSNPVVRSNLELTCRYKLPVQFLCGVAIVSHDLRTAWSMGKVVVLLNALHARIDRVLMKP